MFTKHAEEKMRFYRLSSSRVKRVIRHPARVEQGVLEGAVAVMSPAESKTYSEIWVMYLPSENKEQLRIITAWRYPGKSPERDPVPDNVLKEVRKVLQGF